MTNILLHVNTDEVGVKVSRAEDGGLEMTVDSRDSFISSLTADSESAHRIGDIAYQMRANTDGTHVQSDANYKVLRLLNAKWVEENGITREWLRREE